MSTDVKIMDVGDVSKLNRKNSLIGENGKSKKSPFGQLLDAVADECLRMGVWNEDLQRDLPKKWEKHGDMILLPEYCFIRPEWRMLGRKLWKIVAESLQCERLGKKRRIEADDYRSPHIELLYGPHGWVEHIDNGVKYQYDVTKCMFSIGNITEKLRIASFDCKGETVVDMFAGIGYFTLPYLIHAKAALVYACDWNPDAIEALNRTLVVNKVEDKCVVLEGDCRKVCPVGLADRVNLGLIPTASPYWLIACKALKSSGGYLHIHENVTSSKLQKSMSCDKESSVGGGGSEAASGRLAPREKGVCFSNILEKTLSLDETAAEANDVEEEQTRNNISNNIGQLPETISSTPSFDSGSEPTSEIQDVVIVASMPVRRRLSQTIGDEMANLDLLVYDPPIANDFADKWRLIDKSWRNFAINASRKIHRYLNNLHHKQFIVKICRIGKIKSYAPRIDHLVLDLFCEPAD